MSGQHTEYRSERTESYLADGDNNNLRATTVHFLHKLATDEAQDVGSNDASVSANFGGLFLFFPVDDVANHENTRMTLYLKGRLDLDEPSLCQDSSIKRSKVSGVGLCSEWWNLFNRELISHYTNKEQRTYNKVGIGQFLAISCSEANSSRGRERLYPVPKDQIDTGASYFALKSNTELRGVDIIEKLLLIMDDGNFLILNLGQSHGQR